jgi:hypothetical protein
MNMWWLLRTDAVTEQKLILMPGFLDTAFIKYVRELFEYCPLVAGKLMVGGCGDVLLILYLAEGEHLFTEELLDIASSTQAVAFTPSRSSERVTSRIWLGSSEEEDTLASPLLQ